LLNVLFGGTKRARSAKSLARKLDVPEDALARTVAAYDAAAIAGTEDPAGKSPDYNKPLASSRLTALNLATGNPYSFTITFTLGGLVVDEETGGVRDASGDVIPGLYAAGRTAVGLCSGGYISGMSIADTVFSGRRASASILRTLNHLSVRLEPASAAPDPP
jgi:3-oxo-5alpha-steroid 4-dehydrogenase